MFGSRRMPPRPPDARKRYVVAFVGHDGQLQGLTDASLRDEETAWREAGQWERRVAVCTVTVAGET